MDYWTKKVSKSRIVKWSTVWKTVWQFLKNLKIELPYDSAIPLLSIYLKELKTGSQRDICTLMFIAALFTVVKNRSGRSPSVH